MIFVIVKSSMYCTSGYNLSNLNFLSSLTIIKRKWQQAAELVYDLCLPVSRGLWVSVCVSEWVKKRCRASADAETPHNEASNIWILYKTQVSVLIYIYINGF